MHKWLVGSLRYVYCISYIMIDIICYWLRYPINSIKLSFLKVSKLYNIYCLLWNVSSKMMSVQGTTTLYLQLLFHSIVQPRFIQGAIFIKLKSRR